MSGGQAALQVLIGVVQAVGIVLLIMGAVQLMAGKSRTLMLAACVLELVICLFYIILYAAIDSSGIDVIQGAKAVLIGFAVFFAIMPTISLVLSMGQQSTQYLQARRPVA
jgi:Kef-type K+ transport system membrane component KefB